MKVLLDSHTLIWAADEPSRLGARASIVLKDPASDLYVGAGTIWELAIKVSLGKLTLSMPFRQWMATAMADLGLQLLPITIDHADAQTRLARHHGDPFDRLLIAQAAVESLGIVSSDVTLDLYGAMRIW